MTDSEFTFYFGAASGSARKALRQLEEPNVMINYATQNNRPWDGIERLFIDSGGYSFMMGKGEYETPNGEYLSYLNEHKPAVWALRDYPCEPDVLDEHNRTVADHQRMTADRHADLLNDASTVPGDPLAVLQGWQLHDYLECIDLYRDRGLLTDYVGIGSVCRRNAEAEIRRIITAVRDELNDSINLHAFGVKSSVLKYADVRAALASADSNSFDFRAQWGALKAKGAGNMSFRDSALEYLRQRRRIAEMLHEESEEGRQQTLIEAT